MIRRIAFAKQSLRKYILPYGMVTTTVLKYGLPILLVIALVWSCANNEPTHFSTNYLDIRINAKRMITSIRDITKVPGRELSPSEKPSPLLCLYNSKLDTLYEPQNAVYRESDQIIALGYGNKSIAEIKVVPKDKYLKFTLVSLTHREDIEGVQWGSLHTIINRVGNWPKFGSLI
ncbi:hypothetical protein K8352_15645 [Flavobacteriaceae bacterium F89]|uniref:Uncharacterized protein n=1 Tax=Cerina litoralis TaxID=2874477 RepID=A0AAE3JS84_9FLAO|nr:hypothetical protein [Cerina litoralis]MCG2462193.1 hypothetical protein [Cerina litoralis]